MARWTVSEAVRDLSSVDRVFAGLVERHGAMPTGRPIPVDGRFEVLARAIAHQQLSGRAAATIWARVLERLGAPASAEAVLATDPAALRACGLSESKVTSLLELAAHASDGRLALGSIGRLDDVEVIERLVAVRGIGPWTAQMFLMTALRRPDVWPTGDLGVRVGFGRAWLDGRVPSSRELDTLGERFRPWRSVVAWYCWRATDDPALG